MVNDLIPNEKCEKWVLHYEDSKGLFVEHYDSKDDVFMRLVDIRDSEKSLTNIFVFPPNSSLSYSDFLSYN